jgi:hypothetical protein
MNKLLAVIALAACNPYLQSQSPAPPGRSARLDEVTNWWGVVKSYRVEVSQGVALAVTCYQGGPCEHMKITSDAPAIAEVRPASFGVLQSAGYFNAQTAAAFVIVGKAPGVAHMHLSSKDGERDIAVTVIAPPAPAPAPSGTSTPATPVAISTR